MKALFLRENKVLSLEETPRPSIIDDEDVVIRVTATTICGSDIHILEGLIPSLPDFILGHEFVGVIDEVGPAVKRFKPGNRVVVPAIPFCGSCSGCRKGEYYRCSDSHMFGWRTPRANLSGGQAEYVRVPYADSCLVPIPDALTDKQVLLVGDVLSTAYFGITNAGLKPGDDIAIFGAGPVGLCAVACARLFSPRRIILVDKEVSRLQMGRVLGATHTLQAGNGDVRKEIKTIAGKKGVEVSLDAAGLPSTLDDCIRVTTIGGTISIVGVGPDSFPVNMGAMFMKNLTLKSGLVNLNQMDVLIKLIESGQLDLTPLFTHEMPLEDILDAYRIFAHREDNCIKILLRP